MAEAFYPPVPATDGTFSPVPGGVFEVFEMTDTERTTPLPLRVGDGNSSTTVAASDTLAIVPGTYVTSPNVSHNWVSGQFVWRRDSFDRAEQATEESRQAAVAAAADAATSAQAATDAAGLVEAPADVVIRDTLANPATLAGAHVEANYGKVRTVKPGDDLQGALLAGGRVRIRGTHTITTQLTIGSNTHFDAEPGAVLDISGMAASVPSVTITGTAGTAQPLASDAAQGATTLELVDATGVLAGDYVKVSSSQVWGSTNQPRGEIVRVVSVEGNTVTLEDPLHDTYPAASSGQVEKLTFAENITLQGIRWVGGTDTTKHTTALDVKVAKNLRLIDLNAKNCHTAVVYLTDVIQSSVTGCHFEDCRMIGFGYGIGVLYACQDLTITNCTGVKMRHLVTTGGGTSRRGVSRRIAVSNCTASQMDDAGFDAHPASEYVSFVGCHVSGSGQDGIVMQSGRFTIDGCTVSGATRYGILLQNLTIRGLDGVVSNNVVNGATLRGIAFIANSTAAYQVWGGLVVTGNNVTDSGRGISIENTTTTFSVEGVAVVGNVIRRTLTSHGLYLRGLISPVVEGNHVFRAAETFEVCYLFNCPESVVSGNVLDGGGVSQRALRLLTSSDSSITGNLMKRAVGQGILTDAPTENLIYMGNRNLCTTKGSLSGTGNIQSTADASGAYNL